MLTCFDFGFMFSISYILFLPKFVKIIHVNYPIFKIDNDLNYLDCNDYLNLMQTSIKYIDLIKSILIKTMVLRVQNYGGYGVTTQQLALIIENYSLDP